MIYAKITEQAKCDCVISRSVDSEGSTNWKPAECFILSVRSGTCDVSAAGRFGRWRRCAAGGSGTASWAWKTLAVWTVALNSTPTRWCLSWTLRITCTDEEHWSKPGRLVRRLWFCWGDRGPSGGWTCTLFFIVCSCTSLPVFSVFTVTAQSGGESARTLRQVAPGLAVQSCHSYSWALGAELAVGRGGGGHDPLQDHLPVHWGQRAGGQQIPGSLQR